MNRFRAALGAILLFTLPEPARTGEMAAATVKKVRSATVEIHIKGQLRGGGALVKNSKGKMFVITAAHLFPDQRDTCVVFTDDDTSYFASLSAYDLGHDLALLEISPEAAKHPTLPVAGSVPPETSPLFNFGPALRRRTLVLAGSVADARTSYTDFTGSKGYIAHFFVAGISPVLTSGGTWVNASGQIVGIQHGRLIGDEGAPSSGISMVSPPSAVRALIESNENAATPGLGAYFWEVWTADRSLLDELPAGTEGLIANPVFEDRPLDRAGVKQNDIIISCDGAAIRRRHQLIEKIRSKPVGTTFRLDVMTPGKNGTRPVEVTTDSLEEHWK